MTYHRQQASLGATGVVQSSDPETQRAIARELYSAGQTFFDRGEYQTALARFTEAYSAVPHPAVLLAIGAAMIKLERYQDAKHRFQRYLREEPSGALASRARSQIEYVDYVLSEQARVAALGPGVKPDPTEDPVVVDAPEVPASVPERGAAPPPPVAVVYDDETPTIVVWVATGVGVLALAGAGYYLLRRQKKKRAPKPNRRRRRRRTSRR